MPINLYELYEEYLRELEKMTKEPFRQTAKEILSEYDRRCHDFRLIFDKGKLVGFLIIGWKPNCHPDCDYFICQSYLKPESRGRGLMKNSLDRFVRDNGGRYCLDILFENHEARKYWLKRFEELGYRQIDLPFIEHGVTGVCESLYFEEEA